MNKVKKNSGVFIWMTSQETPQEKVANQRLELVDQETSKLLDILFSLLQNSKISDNKANNELESLQMAVQSSQLIHSCEKLLLLVQQLKNDIILNDFDRFLFKGLEQKKHDLNNKISTAKEQKKNLMEQDQFAIFKL